jgi:hypothetical protein
LPLLPLSRSARSRGAYFSLNRHSIYSCPYRPHGPLKNSLIVELNTRSGGRTAYFRGTCGTRTVSTTASKPEFNSINAIRTPRAV